MSHAAQTDDARRPDGAAALRSIELLNGHPLTLLRGDCRQVMKALPDASVNCCVTSPPYWGLRDYGHPDQIGQEPTPEGYLESMRQVCRELWRVLRNDGTLWLNLGDSFAGGASGQNFYDPNGERSGGGRCSELGGFGHIKTTRNPRNFGLKPKDLVGVPWRVALALQAAGWYLRNDIIWVKPNAMPESVSDRCTRSHEHIFLLSKSESYHYDAATIAEPCEPESWHNSDFRRDRNRVIHPNLGDGERNARGATRNKRDVWTVPTMPYKEAHFATFPPDLIKPCILAGCPSGGLVLDPFAGSGTTGKVALELGRRAVLIELNPDYLKLSDERCCTTLGLPLAV